MNAKPRFVRMLLAVFSGLAFLLTSVGAGNAVASSQKKRKPVYYAIKANQTFRVRLNETIGSEKARIGDAFTTTVVDPVYSGNGVLLVPEGSIITGKVINVERAGKKGKPATLDVQFVSLRLPNGRRAALNGSLSDLSTSNSSSDNEGTATAKTTSHRKVKFIGGGAAGGAVIGAIAGGGKGLAIGAGVGAVTGAVAGRLKKGHEVKVDSGTEFGVILNRNLALPKYSPS